VGVIFVDEQRIAELNATYRGKPAATDVLSFPIDGADAVPDGLPRQLGDLVVCPAVASAEGTPIATLLVHGALHLVGYDHETDDGSMLRRQEQLVREVAPVVADPA
jgi:probable rRNA maturation factor